MAGRDLPGPNSLDRKTKFQRNFNQLWWESARERERQGGGRLGVWGERTGGEVGERWCCERAAESREEPWEATTSWAGGDQDSGSALPRGGRCLFAAVGDDAGAKEAALGLLHPAEPS